jgi:hypothetical protein
MEPALRRPKGRPGGCYYYLSLYVFCGKHLFAAKLRRSNIDASAGAVDEVARLPDPRALAQGNREPEFS